MDEVYKKWICKNYPTYESVYGKCEEACKSMIEVFPELNIVRGYYDCPIWGRREHWWLTDSKGSIIDPTVLQFPSKGLFNYTPLTDVEEIPTGKCPNCGEYCFNNTTLCSKNCEKEYLEYLNN